MKNTCIFIAYILEIDQYSGLADIWDWYFLAFTDMFGFYRYI